MTNSREVYVRERRGPTEVVGVYDSALFVYYT